MAGVRVIDYTARSRDMFDDARISGARRRRRRRPQEVGNCLHAVVTEHDPQVLIALFLPAGGEVDWVSAESGPGIVVDGHRSKACRWEFYEHAPPTSRCQQVGVILKADPLESCVFLNCLSALPCIAMYWVHRVVVQRVSEACR